MITDQDVKKLKKTFATKDDLKNLENRMDKKFVTKEEHRSSVKELADSIKTVISMVGKIDQKLDKALEKSKEHDDILQDHERQIDRLNNKVLS